ncbi:MAG: putative porin [Bdellovibrionaceae bacterium]|nr:putative porin [Pseudobdellovibrionaceae bacterium]MBX3032967.1 putative porin [Pseudobdellovibrionaceae bacterium]
MHLVKRGETFSQIALKYLGRPVYTKKSGSIAKLRELNPQVEEPDRIYSGQELVIRMGERKLASDSQPGAEAETQTGSVVAAEETIQKKTVPSERGESSFEKSPTVPKARPLTSLEREEEVTHALTLSALYQFMTLSTKDPTSGSVAELQTSRDLLAEAKWSQIWSDSFSSYAAFSVCNVDFEPSTNTSKSLSSTAKTLFGLYAGAEHKLSNRFSLRYGAGIGQELFLHGLNSSIVRVDSIAVPRASIGARLEVFKKGSTSFGLDASVAQMFSATTDSYSVNSGQSYGAALYIQKMTATDRRYNLSVGFRQRSQDTSILQVKETAFFGGVSFSLPLFERDGKK